jgi:hypothetical protein
MQRKAVIICFLVVCLMAIAVLAVLLLRRGGSLEGVLFAATIFFLLLAIPIIEVVGYSITLLPRRIRQTKLLMLFLVSPLTVGIIVLATYPSSLALGAILCAIVMLAVSIFVFLVK